jgi:hypothetical protein
MLRPMVRGFAAALLVFAASGLAARTAQAQSPSMDHMSHESGQMPMPAPSDDSRVLVSLPAPMQAHMLADMRDHLATLNTVFGDIGDGRFDDASKLLEDRLGMTSLPLHQAAEMAPYFPQGMQDAGTAMHHAASRLAIALQNAAVAHTFESMREVNAALHAVTSSCVACHSGYRVR